MVVAVSAKCAPVAVLAILIAAGCGGREFDSPTEPPEIGSYDDRYDFRSFAGELDRAVADGDVDFFWRSVRLEDQRCEDMLPYLPNSCRGQALSSIVAAIPLSTWRTTNYYLDRDGYEEFVRDFLLKYNEDSQDQWGGGEARLYAYGIIKPELRGEVVGDDPIDAILTRRVTHIDFEQREVLLLTTAFDGENWRIERLMLGPDTFLGPEDPSSSENSVSGAFEFWRFWVDNPFAERPADAADQRGN